MITFRETREGSTPAVQYWYYPGEKIGKELRESRAERDSCQRSHTRCQAAHGRPRLLAAGDLVGRLEIPRLEGSAIVRAGSDARTLRLAVGHISGTAMPGDAGNVGLAGDRDTFFRQLQHVRGGDEIRVVTPVGTHVYRVERTLIVEPGDVWVLNPSTTGILTLVTRYPFNYLGSAPQRFIVRASLTAAPAVPLGQPSPALR